MELQEIKKMMGDLVNIRNNISKQSNSMVYKKKILDLLDFSISNLKLQEKDEVYRLYLIEQRMKNE